MKKILIVVDMQNDFIDGTLGTPEAQAIVPKVVKKIENFDGDTIIFTKDTHFDNYLETQEGKRLPVVHCIIGAWGWELNKKVTNALIHHPANLYKIKKPTFGSMELTQLLSGHPNYGEDLEIEFCGLCTGICVISNAMLLKAAYKEAHIVVDASCCACVTPESHKTALEAMKLCQIDVINE